MSIPSPQRDSLFVQVDTASLERTASGLYIPDWQPGDKDAQQATVVALPKTMSGYTLGFPNLDGGAYVHSDIKDTIARGDTVYLKPNTFRANAELPGYPGVFLVPINKVIAVATHKHSQPVPYQGLLLCKPVYHESVVQQAEGVPVKLAAGTSLVVELDPLPIPFLLQVLMCGEPLRNQQDLVKVGDIIVAHKMLFAYHAVKQKDNEEASGRWMWEPSTIIMGGYKYCYVPRQCIMATLQSTP